MDFDAGTWTCEACTYVNEGYLSECEVCGTPKGLPPIAASGAGAADADASYVETLTNWNEVRRLAVQDNRVLYADCSKALEDACKHMEKPEAQTLVQQVAMRIIDILLDQRQVTDAYLASFQKAFESYISYYSGIAGHLAEGLSSSASSTAAGSAVTAVPAEPAKSLDTMYDGVSGLCDTTRGFYKGSKAVSTHASKLLPLLFARRTQIHCLRPLLFLLFV